jgi:hypothetical protein
MRAEYYPDSILDFTFTKARFHQAGYIYKFTTAFGGNFNRIHLLGLAFLVLELIISLILWLFFI